MLRVHRYVLEPGSGEGWTEDDSRNGFVATVALDAPGDVLGVGLTSRGPVVYALADADRGEKVERGFYVIGNGRDLPEAAGQYVGTAKLPGAPTFHVFELVAVPAGT